MNVLETLIAAKARVALRWTKGESVLPGGAVCATGAILQQKGASPETRVRAENYLSAALDKMDPISNYPETTGDYGLSRPGYHWGEVEGWNDSPNRKKADVLGLYDRAITNAKRRHILGD